MELQEYQARSIIKEINQVLPQKINLMNKQGIIIASSDPARINTYHGGAARIIQEGLDELRIAYDNEIPGTKTGTNFMLKVEGEPIGVLGITGEYDVILPLANVIRKMTELLVYQQENDKMQSNLRYQQSLFFTELLNHSEGFFTEEQIERGRSIGIDIQLTRRILAVDLANRDKELLSQRQDLFNTLEAFAQQKDSSCCCTITNQIMVFFSSFADKEQLRAFAKELQSYAHNQGWDICIGIDGGVEDNSYLSEAFKQAKKALQSCHRKGNVSIKSYDEINMEIFADDIPLVVKKAYVKKIFKGYSRQELADAIATLECFFEHDGSITKTAEALYIHKNTLQQHLKRIYSRTGYDPRSIRNSAVFYLVMYLYQDI